MAYTCANCGEKCHYENEVVFDDDELKTVDEKNPDWDSCICVTCYYESY
jgi:hypothetical protein